MKEEIDILHCLSDYQQEKTVKKVKAYAGSLTNKEQLKFVASGGAGTVIAKIVIENGGVVIGAAYTDAFKSAKYVVVKNEEDLNQLKGSKYISVRKGSGEEYIYKKVQDNLVNGKQVLFIGLPCDVGALYSWIKKKNITTEKLITVDLVCHGCTIEKIQRQFIEMLEKKYKSQIKKFSTRYVDRSWALAYLYAQFENGQVYKKPLYETDLGFAIKYYLRRSCFNCQFKGENHRADITIGDYWGLTPKDRLYNKGGVSLLLAKSVRGLELIKQIDKKEFDFTQVDFTDAVKHNSMYLKSERKQDFYEEFEKTLNHDGLHEAVVHSAGYRVYKKAALKRRLYLLLGKI